jgi:Ca2+:H+ antiporter
MYTYSYAHHTFSLRLLQATLAGVVLLHLLLVPGMAFLTGGARILEQNLHAHQTQLNLSLLSIG